MVVAVFSIVTRVIVLATETWERVRSEFSPRRTFEVVTSSAITARMSAPCAGVCPLAEKVTSSVLPGAIAEMI